MRRRYTQSRRQSRHDSRTIPVMGMDEDRDRYFRCWHCGFICDVRREPLGGQDSPDGLRQTDFHAEAYGSFDRSDPLNSIGVLDGDIGFNQVTLEANQMPAGFGIGRFGMEKFGSGENPGKLAVHSHEAVGTGCPFCHTLNWRGDF